MKTPESKPKLIVAYEIRKRLYRLERKKSSLENDIESLKKHLKKINRFLNSETTPSS